jgi:hypothetical protein
MNAQTLPLFTLMMFLSSNLYCKGAHYRDEFLGMCACMSVCPSVCVYISAVPIGQISMKSDTEDFCAVSQDSPNLV